MYIESISFSQKPINGKGWEIKECNFNKINLITGQNSAGKTRLLKSIATLVKILLNDKARVSSGFDFEWNIILQGKENKYIYQLKIENTTILYEKLLIDDIEYFSRDENGRGEIKYEYENEIKDEDEVKLRFEIDKHKIVLSSKRDKTQHPALEPLFKWFNSVYLYKFGDKLGRDTFMSPKLYVAENEIFNQIKKDDDAVVLKFEKALKMYSDKFKKEVIEDFNNIGYNIKNINTTKLNEVFEKLPNEIQLSIPSILYIEEDGIEDKIFQQDISQGMFRALSLIIQMKYLEYELDTSTTILIDDIGEGLDYERSTKLIKYIIEKVKNVEDKVQLIMTTNDRFTMNNIPLEYWIIIDKEENGKINFYTKKTHPECFEDFEDIGLNNFDFFSGQYYKNCIGQN